MPSNKKVITLGFDYSQLDAGTAEINRKMGLLESQFKLTKEQIKAYGDEADTLTLHNDKLTQQIILQTKKVDLAKEAYDKALASGKATDKSLDSLQKAYINNQTTLQKLNNELAENKTKLDKVNDSSKSFGDSIRGMASAIGLDVSPALEAVASKFDGINKGVGDAVIGIGAVIGAFVSCSVSAANMADDLLQLSSTTGISTDQLQKMQYASDFLDVSLDDMTSSLTKLERSMNSARSGSKDTEDAFKKLHISIKDSSGQLLNAEDVFYATIDALGKVKNETERDALAMTVFGKSAKELNPLIEAGSKRLKELGIEAEDMGAIMSGKSLEDLGAFKDSMDRLDNTFDAVKLQLGMALLPILQAFASLLSKIPAPVLTGIAVFGTLAVIFTTLTKAIATATAAQATMSAANVALGATGTIAAAGMGEMLIILMGVALVIGIIVGSVAAIKQSLKEVSTAGDAAISSATNKAKQLQSAQSATIKSVGYANGTKSAPGGWSVVGEEGPEWMYVPRGSQIYSNADSKAMSTGDTINNYFSINARDIKEVENLIDIMNSYKQTVRQGRLKNA